MAGELIGREALERIIKRAAELQAGEREIGDGLSEPELLTLGKDVGIPDRFLRQALLEEQTRTTPEQAPGPWVWLTGPTALVAHRIVPGDRETIDRALARWMQDEEMLQPKRRYPDRTVWEPRAGAFASIQRALAGSRRYILARVFDVTTQIVQLEPGFCLVRFEASVRKERNARVGGGAAMTAAGLGMSGVLTAIGLAPAFELLALLPGVGLTAGAFFVARSHVGQNERIVTAMEQVLDRLERGEIRAEHALPGPPPRGPAGAFLRLAEEIKKSFQL
jgi:hypothetical protein